ncbi:hypothetical protein NDU88_004636, partial [Pleurodeles waltl]
ESLGIKINQFRILRSLRRKEQIDLQCSSILPKKNKKLAAQYNIQENTEKWVCHQFKN